MGLERRLKRKAPTSACGPALTAVPPARFLVTPEVIAQIAELRTELYALPCLGKEFGERSTIYTYRLDGWAEVRTRQSVDTAEAWAAYLMGAMRDGYELAPDVSLLMKKGTARYYRVTGGPLAGMLVKAFQRKGEACTVIFGTPEHAREQGWPVKGMVTS